MASKKYVQAVTESILNGAFPEDALSMNEATLNAAETEKFVDGRWYKGLVKNAMSILKRVEDVDGYRKGFMKEDPQGALESELDDLEYVGTMLSGLSLKNYPSEVYQKLSKITDSLFNGLKRARKKIDELSGDPDKLREWMKPMEYSKRALSALTDAMAILGLPWDFDFKWNNYLNDPKSAKKMRPIDTTVPAYEGEE